MKYATIGLLLSGLCALPPGARAQDCGAPQEYVEPGKPLAGLAAAIQKGGPIHILAVGSATTVGEDADGSVGASFPYRMADALRAALPTLPVVLTVRGGKGMTAESMLPLLKQGLTQQPAALVLWQTGTVEAVRAVKLDTMRAALDAGIASARAAGADVVLIDPPFSRVLRSNTDLDPYQSLMRQAAKQTGVALFRRFDLMRAWADRAAIDLEKVAKPERGAAVGRLHGCLGATLARFVAAGAK